MTRLLISFISMVDGADRVSMYLSRILLGTNILIPYCILSGLCTSYYLKVTELLCDR